MRKTLHIPHGPELTLPSGTVGLSFSAGADSTLLFFLLLEQTDLPVHLFQTVSRWLECCELPIAANIMHWLNQRYPNREITHTIKYADNPYSVRKILFLEANRALYQDDRITSFLTGLTKSPGLDQQAERFPEVLSGHNHTERNNEVNHPIRKGLSWYSPINNLDKRQVYQIYQQYQIEELWHLTRSCARSAVPCGECWWCTERVWATEPKA